jgi:hypothetical protein
MRPGIKKIARFVILAKSYLSDAHKIFGAVNATGDDELGKEEREVGQAVVTSIDALHPITYWAIENS